MGAVEPKPRIEPVSEAQLDQLLPLIAAYQRFYEVEEMDEERNRAFFPRFIAPSDDGLLLIDSVNTRDYPVITGVFLIVGVVHKPHGIKGELSVRVETDHPGAVFGAGKTLLLGDAPVLDADRRPITLRASSGGKAVSAV